MTTDLFKTKDNLIKELNQIKDKLLKDLRFQLDNCLPYHETDIKMKSINNRLLIAREMPN